MPGFESLFDASNAVRRWLLQNEDKLPETLQERLTNLTNTGTSPVDLTMTFVEAVYANQKDFSKAAKDLAADAAEVGVQNGFHGMAEGYRGQHIQRVLRGEKLKTAPEPRADLVPQPEPDKAK